MPDLKTILEEIFPVEIRRRVTPDGTTEDVDLNKRKRDEFLAKIEGMQTIDYKKLDILSKAYSKVIMRVYDGERIEKVEPEEMKKANRKLANLGVNK